MPLLLRKGTTFVATQSIAETAETAETAESRNEPHLGPRRIATVIGVVLGLGVLLVGIVLVAGGIFAPPRYNAPSAPSYHEQFGDLHEQLVAHGLLP